MMNFYGLEFMKMIINPWLSDVSFSIINISCLYSILISYQMYHQSIFANNLDC